MKNQVQSSTLKDKLKAYIRYLIIGMVLLLTISLARNISSSSDSLKTIKKREAEVIAIEEENKALAEKLKKVNSEAFIEGQVRDQLGLAKPGEIVLVLPESEVLESLVPGMSEEEAELPDPNWKKWIQLFVN